MQNRMKLLLSAVLLIILILSMVTHAFATEAEPTTEHVHNWQILSSTSQGHYLSCTTCHETQRESHTFNSEEVCIICGRYFHTHKWQRISADSQFHTVVCTVCDESQTVTHSMRAGVCTVCGYEEHIHTMQYVGGVSYPESHETQCTSCDAIAWEPHTFGSDDKCTVCGAERPCEHQWISNGEQSSSRYHILACACGATMTEKHSWTWNSAGNYAVCTGCNLKDSGHFHVYIYPNGTRCIECGYEKTQHVWQNGNSFNQYHHVMVCTRCGITQNEPHNYKTNGVCLVCGYDGSNAVESETQPNGTEPAETESTESDSVNTKPTETESTESESVNTEPAETESTESESVNTEPAETGSTETEPVKAAPTDTDPAEVDSGKANSTEKKPEAAETIGEEDEEVDSQSDGSTTVWVVAVVTVAAALAIGLFYWKKKSS